MLIRSVWSQAEPPWKPPPLLCSWTVSDPPRSDKAPVDGGDWEEGRLLHSQEKTEMASRAKSSVSNRARGMILKSHLGHRPRSLHPMRCPTVSRQYFPGANVCWVYRKITKALYIWEKRASDVKVITLPVGTKLLNQKFRNAKEQVMTLNCYAFENTSKHPSRGEKRFQTNFWPAIQGIFKVILRTVRGKD